jgi:hypothetical protein
MRFLKWGSVTVALGLALAGCGGGGDGAPPTPAASQPLAAAVTSSGTATDDFESGMAGWSNWDNAQVVAGAGTSGSHAMQVGTGAGGAGLTIPGIVPRTTYRLTAHVRTSSASEYVNANNLGVKFLDASGNEVGSGGLRTEWDAANPGWMVATSGGIAPQNAVSALVWVWKVAGSSYVYVDDVVFEVSSPAPPPPPPGNLVPEADSGFESGMADWVNEGNAGVVFGDAGFASFGALQVGTHSPATPGGGAGRASLRVSGVVPGTTYRLQAQVKVETPAEPITMGVTFQDASGNFLAGFVSPAASNTAYGALTVDAVAPANAVYAQIWVSKPAGNNHVYVDDVTLAPLGNSPPPESNLLSNGGFESGLAQWVNWGNAATSATQPYAGSAAAQVGTAAGGFGQTVSGIVAGNAYRLSAQVKVSRADEVGFVGVKFMDDSGTSLLDRNVAFTSTAWSRAQLDLTAPANAIRALVYVWKNDGSGFAYLDDVAFGVAPSSAANLVLNGGFESGLAQWVNWGNAATSATQPFAGSAAAQVGTAAGGFGQTVRGIVAGNAYRLSAQVKVSRLDEVGFLGVKFMDDSGTSLLDRNVAFTSTAWSRAQLDLTAPANATRALVYVWKNDGSGFAYLDEITMLRVSGSMSP